MEILAKEFQLALNMSKPDKPLVLVLDSIDQLDSNFDGRLMAWLPAKLPPHTKVIISTLPEEQYECFKAMKVIFVLKCNLTFTSSIANMFSV